MVHGHILHLIDSLRSNSILYGRNFHKLSQGSRKLNGRIWKRIGSSAFIIGLPSNGTMIRLTSRGPGLRNISGLKIEWQKG
ncbi:hypothetical protein AUI46_07335 [archaeon 13_1_40CM_2_52_13]|nr:MAG: hypothetical protein AUI46_07335 [archaeon 13_1_40CM_2_52_13]